MSARLSIDPANFTPDGLIHDAARLLDATRDTAPLVHSITNDVVTNFTANVLLAFGAAPAMVDIVGEAGLFARVASGMLVNLGTPTPEQRAASLEAVDGANAAGTPWVLDPVAIGSLPIRTAHAATLVHERPTVVRGNPSEIIALAGLGSGGRGVDAADPPDDARDAALTIARTHGSVVAVSGPVDLLTDGVRVVRVANGTELLTRLTGGGCALGSFIAGFVGANRGDDALVTVTAAVVAYTVAAELAAIDAAGPGTFAIRFLDALSTVTAADVRTRARLSVETVAA